MKKYAVLLLCLASIFIFTTYSCDDTLLPGLQILYSIIIDEVEYETAGTYSFGDFEAESGSSSVTMTINNLGEVALTVTAVELTVSEHFSVAHEEVPLTVEPGETTAATVSFNPMAAGALSASISISLEGLTNPFVLNFSGGGIYTTDYDVHIAETEYTNGGTYNFGLTAAESETRTAALVLTNTGGTDLTVTAAGLSEETNFSLEEFDLPITIASGETAEADIYFSPQESGDLSDAISISFNEITEPYILNFTGEGNYAPVVTYGIEVTGAGTTDANGIYLRTGEYEELPMYYKSGSPEYACYSNADNTSWSIRGNIDGYMPFYFIIESTISPPAGIWSTDYDFAEDPAPTIARYDLTGTYGQTGETLTANYFYSDADGDPEDPAGTTYRWWFSDDQTEPDTIITGETEKTFTPDGSYNNSYIWVEVTPVAAAGVTTGIAVMSRSTAEIEFTMPVD